MRVDVDRRIVGERNSDDDDDDDDDDDVDVDVEVTDDRAGVNDGRRIRRLISVLSVSANIAMSMHIINAIVLKRRGIILISISFSPFYLSNFKQHLFFEFLIHAQTL